MGSNDERIILNVGGIKYETNRSTLTKYPETYLGTIFGENFKRQKKDNEYFFDRNGYAFRYILEYHRTGQILWAPSNDSGLCNGVSLKEMVLEFEFFKIPNELNEDHDDKEYDLNEIRDLFKELSVTSFPSKTLNDSKNESLSINNPPSTIGDDRRNLVTTGTQSHYPNTQYPQHSNTSQHSNISQNSQYHNPVSQTYSSTPNINNTNNNVEMGRLRRWATVEEHGKDNQHSSSIEFDLDLDRIKEIMKPFKACGVKLLEWYGNEIVKN
uniref:BTB domain-containing protein n=1 Tax=Rhizophagus irregularis (strain DAOM 181602 / DAOM 197198 / MUCL 43194) TaxID=747089 RepID=U9TMP2_RHIID